MTKLSSADAQSQKLLWLLALVNLLPWSWSAMETAGIGVVFRDQIRGPRDSTDSLIRVPTSCGSTTRRRRGARARLVPARRAAGTTYPAAVRCGQVCSTTSTSYPSRCFRRDPADHPRVGPVATVDDRPVGPVGPAELDCSEGVAVGGHQSEVRHSCSSLGPDGFGTYPTCVAHPWKAERKATDAPQRGHPPHATHRGTSAGRARPSGASLGRGASSFGSVDAWRGPYFFVLEGHSRPRPLDGGPEERPRFRGLSRNGGAWC